MGRLNQFEVAFARPKVFYAGQQVAGDVIIGLTEPVKINSITIRFIGQANVRYKHVIRGRKGSSTKEYSASEEYINTKQILYNSAESDTSKLPEGTHKFPFVYPLPDHLPTSFEAKDGRIRYWVKVSVSRPRMFKTRRKIVPFTVVQNFNLNSQPQLWNPLLAEHRSSAPWYMLCMAGEVHASFRVDKTGFVPGETIRVSGEINNHTFSTVKGATLSLIQHVEFIGRGGATRDLQPHHNSFPVIHTKTGLIGPRVTNRLENFQLVVPPVPPTDHQHCGILKIDYELGITVDCGQAKPIIIHRNVTIGTIPLTERPVSTIPTAVAGAGAAAETPPPYVGPPPEYRQGTSGTFSYPDDHGVTEDDVREGDDPVEVSTDYAPLYPVYENINRYACAEKEALRDEHKTNPMLEYRNSSS